MRQLNLRAMAKVNLGLDVTGRREDGYHDLRMIMQTVRLFDSISLSVTRSEGVRMRTNLGFLPTDDGNLAVKAAKLLMEEFRIEEGVFIDLKKKIPVAAGLAGGSSDAAAVLVGHTFLHYEGDCPGGGNRRYSDSSGVDSALRDPDRETGSSCVDQICLYAPGAD